jgi:hypothetical protein
LAFLGKARPFPSLSLGTMGRDAIPRKPGPTRPGGKPKVVFVLF